MSYKKFCKSVSIAPRLSVSKNTDNDQYGSIYSKYKNYLPVVYQGPSNRVERYAIYDGMEQDPNISYSLDTLAEYITQSNNDEPFQIEYDMSSSLPDSHTKAIEKALDNWVKLNSWKKRIFGVVRDVLKFGDIVFIRDPETNILNKCNIYDVLGVICDENKKPLHYVIRNVDLNVPMSIATSAKNDITTKNLLNTLNTNVPTNVTNSTIPMVNDPSNDMSIVPVDAKYIVHLTTNIDNILLYPFGVSTLESIYKTYIQKMMLQDCILLYRIKNATDKIVFSIPVGNIPRYKVKQVLEKCKNEISQRRMPTKDSNGMFNTIDVAYNSIPQTEDFWLPITADGQQPKVERLQGGQNLGEINDMVYWENQLIRGLKVPQSWVPYGPSDGQRSVPTATASTYVQEQRFFKYCKRIQILLIDDLDAEFKQYLQKVGLNVDEDSFKLSFFQPSNITELTEMELKKQRLDLCNTAMSNPYISKQFALKKYLNLSEEEYNENEKLRLQEMQEILKSKEVEIPAEDENQVPGLRSIGIEDIPMNYMSDMTDQMQGGIDNLGGGMDMSSGGEMDMSSSGDMSGAGMGIEPSGMGGM